MNATLIRMGLIATLIHTAAVAAPTAGVRVASYQTAQRGGGYVSFAGAGVKLVKPSGFETATNFEGLQLPAKRASIMVAKIPGPYAEVSRGFTAEHMKPRAMTLRSKQAVKVQQLPGILVHFTQNAAGSEWVKWALVFGNASRTMMVTATFPREHEGELSQLLKKAVLTTRLDGAAPAKAAADAGFTLAGSPKLKLTPGIGKMVVYTREGVLPAKSPESPVFIATTSLSDTVTADPSDFARERLHQTAHTKILAVTTHAPITVNGMNGYESIAEAEDAKSREPVVLYQVMLFKPAGYILAQGLVGSGLRDEYLPEFKAMARSLKRK